MVVYALFKAVCQADYTEPQYYDVAEDAVELLELYESEAQANEICKRLNRDVPVPDDPDKRIPERYYYVTPYTIKKANGGK